MQKSRRAGRRILERLLGCNLLSTTVTAATTIVLSPIILTSAGWYSAWTGARSWASRLLSYLCNLNANGKTYKPIASLILPLHHHHHHSHRLISQGGSLIFASHSRCYSNYNCPRLLLFEISLTGHHAQSRLIGVDIVLTSQRLLFWQSPPPTTVILFERLDD
jgi:hypothetical protein